MMIPMSPSTLEAVTWVVSSASTDLVSKCLCILVYARLLIRYQIIHLNWAHKYFVHIITISAHIAIANHSLFFNVIFQNSHKNKWMETASDGIFMWQENKYSHKHTQKLFYAEFKSSKR